MIMRRRTAALLVGHERRQALFIACYDMFLWARNKRSSIKRAKPDMINPIESQTILMVFEAS